MLILSTLLTAALLALLLGWWLVSQPILIEDAPPAPPDPVEALVDKWAHDWERGRA